MKKAIAVLLAAMFMLVPFLNASVQATEVQSLGTGTDEKISSSTKVTGSFEDDCVILIMTNEASLGQLHYSTSDFSEVACKSITNLSQAMTSKVELQLSKSAEASSRSSGGDASLNEGEAIDLGTFTQVLCLELEQAGEENVLAAIKLLEQRSDVLCAGPNYIYTLEEEPVYSVSELPGYLPTNTMRSVTTNDTYASQQWAINKISLPAAWAIENGTSHKVTVGIIDTGIDASHPDLVGKVNPSKSRTINELGYISTAGATDDPDGHGTMVAGIIGAYTNNWQGISGVNWNVELVSIKIDDSVEKVNTSALAKAIDYATSQGIKLLNISLDFTIVGFDELCGTDLELDICIYHIIANYPGLIICSAGNENKNIDNINTRYPSSYDLDNIIVVGASTQSDTVCQYAHGQASNYGSRRVDLFAPGEVIYSTMTTEKCTSTGCTEPAYHIAPGYHYNYGTSFATPYVTAVAALIMAEFPNITIPALRSRILAGVDTKAAFAAKCVTGGRLNAEKAVCIHYYEAGVEPYDNVYHRCFCSCGLATYRAHSFVDIGGMEYCTTCGFIVQ